MKDSINTKGAGTPGVGEAPSGSANAGQGWSGRTRGGFWGNWCFLKLIRIAGVRAAYALLLPVAAYFTLVNPKGFRISIQYLLKAIGPRPKILWPLLVFRHYLSMGVSLIDRAAVIMGKGGVECEFQNHSDFRHYLEKGQGIILLGTHFGGWEVASHFLYKLDVDVNLVVLEKEEERMRGLFDRMLKDRKFHVLSTDTSPMRSIAAVAALRVGGILALHGDRNFGGATVSVPFLGEMAEFPVGAYVLAAATGAPLFQVFAVREKLGRYSFFSYPALHIPQTVNLHRIDELKPYVEQYAERIGEVARKHPFQWYNFYPFWGQGNDRKTV